MQPTSPLAAPRLLRLPEVLKLTSFKSPDTVYKLMRAGQFPRQRKLTAHSSAWLECEITAWIESRPVAGADEVAA